MSWFKRIKEGITTSTSEKKEAPDGVWYKCVECKKAIPYADVADNLYVCNNCDYHIRIGSKEYFTILFDNNSFTELFANMCAADTLNFVDLKPYNTRLKETIKKTMLNDAMRSAHGKLNGLDIVVCCMDFAFIGGSMGVVVGEKISKSIDYCIANGLPLMIISKSGGARMMESAFSLMQMAKTSAKLTQLAKAKLPYISLCTDPTTGGVTASYAMLGDLTIAEPKSLIGFAGPRVIKETIKKDLPEGFQTAEFLKETGFLDFIVHRKDLKNKLSNVLSILMHKK
jgi:acetyl-CoA carboxylase carboxyl transferase subunit beta